MRRKLHSQEGCLRCRARRKKCDEQRPVCGNCQKSRFDCGWTGSASIVKHFLPANKILRDVYASLTVKSDPLNIFDAPVGLNSIFNPMPGVGNVLTSQFDLTEHRLFEIFLSMLRTPAIPDPQKISYYRTLLQISDAVAESAWVRSAAFSFVAFITSEDQQSLRVAAFRYYSEALSHLNQEIRNHNGISDQPQQEAMLFATMIMGLKEFHDLENTIYPLPHFELVGNLLHQCGMRIRSVNPSLSHSNLPLHQILVEIYLYHVAVMAFYHPRSYCEVKISPEVEIMITASRSEPQKDTIDSTDLTMYRVLFEIMKFSDVIEWDTSHSLRMKFLESELDQVENQTTNRSLVGLGNASSCQVRSRVLLAVTALRILILKITNRSILPSSEEVRALVTKALQFFEACDFANTWTTYFCWILTILFCASYTTNEFECLQRLLQNLRTGMFPGDMTRMRRVLAILVAQRRIRALVDREEANLVQPEDHDTLVLLVREGGILAEITELVDSSAQ